MKLSYFLKTLGIAITESCLTFDTEEKYCEDGSNKIRFIVNREEIKNPLNYEIINFDKILNDYGSGTELDLKFKFNNNPTSPREFTEPYR